MVVSCNNGTLSTFVPTDDNPWDISKVLLVFRRLGFGIKHSDIASKLSLTPSELIDELIDNAKNLPLHPILVGRIGQILILEMREVIEVHSTETIKKLYLKIF